MGGWASIPSGLAVIAAMIASPAYALDSAGGSGAGKAEHLSVEEAANFSKKVEKTLAEKGARIALVFRSGRKRADLPEKVSYTHGAFWVHQDIQRTDGSLMKGYAVYNLFHGDGEELPRTKSYLHQDFPLDFISGALEDDVAIIIPHPVVQQKMLEVMASDKFETLHVEEYSIIAHPHDARLQNCNEFMLDVMAAAIWQTMDYRQIKANLAASFTPTEISAGPLQRLFAPFVDERIRLKDQKGKIETVTFASLNQFLQDNGYLQESLVLNRNADGLKSGA